MSSITYDEAVESRRKYFSAISKTRDGPMSPKAMHEPGGMKATGLLVQGLRCVLDEPEKIIDEARHDADSFDALRFAAAHHLVLGRQLPDATRHWIAAFLQGKVKRPAGRPGSPSKIGMKVEVFHSVSLLVGKGMAATRNDASERHSACDAVADALKALRMSPSSYERVKAIYLEMKARASPDGQVSLDWAE